MRFKEIISVQKVIDTKTGKEYNCLLDDELFILLNDLDRKIVSLERRLYEKDKLLEKTLEVNQNLEKKLKGD